MKWFAWLLIGLFGLASQASAAYDGPSPPLSKNYSESGINLAFAVQKQVLNGGRARFIATIQVPVAADNVGRNVVFEVWRYLGTGDLRVDDSCTHLVLAGEVGTTVTFNCEIFQLIPGGGMTPGSFVTLYPKVIRNSSGAATELNGLGDPIDVPVVGDDGNEPNNTLLAATTIPVGSPFSATDLVLGLNNDYFRFTAPGGTGSADVTIQFWNSANDLDLWIYDAGGNPITGSVGSTDEERVIFSVTPGVTYYIGVEFSTDTNPAFYDLSVTLAGAHTVTASPSATPSTVASGGTTNLAANGADTLGHALTYTWQHVIAQCPSGTGTFSALNVADPTWTAPVNNSGVAKTCQLRVTVDDGLGTTTQQTVTVTVNPLVHGLEITSGPGGAPNPVPSAGAVAVSVTATDTLGHTIAYAWTANCPTLGGNGTFSSASAQNPTWTAPANGTGSQQSCTLSVTADDGNGLTANANYSQTVLAASSLTNVYYFAEGATINGFFETRLALLNSDGLPATASIDFQLKDTTTVLTHAINVPATSRATVDVSTLGSVNPALAVLASAEFSTVIRSDRPLVADRTMTWTRAQAYGSHGETAITAPAATWYLAEGATIGNFELYYLIQNPNAEAITFTVTYLLPPPTAPLVRVYPIGANTRTNIPVHLEPGLEDVEVSAIIEAPADKPIIVERAMYLTTGGLFYGAGHESAGIRAPATQWFFAEGNTGTFFDLFILIGNPGTTTAQVTATFLFDDGTTCATGAAVDAKSRYNIWVDTLVIPGCPRDLADAAVSTTITADVPVIAERAMWWPGPSAANWAEAHNAAGATVTGVRWGLADGEQGGARGNETYILIANTSSYVGLARVTLYLEDGSTLQKDVPLAANSRTNVAVGAPEASGGFGAAVAGKRFGAVIQSIQVEGQVGPAQIVVERAMYSNGPGAPFWAAGTDVLATRLQ